MDDFVPGVNKLEQGRMGRHPHFLRGDGSSSLFLGKERISSTSSLQFA